MRIWFALALWVGPPVVVTFALRAAEPHLALAPREGVLVLKNGEVLAGTIAWAGDQYFVSRTGSEIGIRTTEVELVARDLDDAYRQKSAAVRRDDLDGRNRVAQWCLRHGLHGYAADEIAAALTLSPRDAEARRLQALLAAAQLPTAKPQAPPPGLDATGAAPPLSSKALQTFATTVQPLLMNRCATAGCHAAPSATKFSLVRFNSRTTPSRRLTQRNLGATLAWIDRAKPDESALITVGRRAHGRSTVPLFDGSNQAQYEVLLRWVKEVAAPVAADAQQPANPAGPGAATKGGERQPAGDAQPFADPLDPAPFNSRFFPTGKPPADDVP